MKKEEKVRLPYVPTYGEEVANTVSHAVMLPLTLCLLPFAAVWTYLHDARPVLASVSVSVCVISIFLMLLASTLYHSMRPDSKHKAVFHKLDHINSRHFQYGVIKGCIKDISRIHTVINQVIDDLIKNGRFTYATCAGKNSKTPNRLMLHNSQCFMIGNTMLWSIFFFRSAWISPPRDRKSTRLNSSHSGQSRMPSSA